MSFMKLPPENPVYTEEFAQAEAPDSNTVSREELRVILAVALRAGQLMLENGANTSRVEETIQRIATALGAEMCDVYATPSGIIVTVYAGAEHRTRIQRITRTNVDLSRIADVIDVSRQAWQHAIDREGVQAALERIARQPRVYQRALTTLAVGIACASTSVLLGGGMWEFIVSFIASALAFFVRDWLVRFQVSRPLLTGLIAALSSGTALGLASAFGAPRAAQAITASVVFLVPGLLMVSSIADLFRGDTISGVARGTSALLTLIAIAGGVWATLLVSQAKIDLEPGRLEFLPLVMLLAFCSAGGFGIMFDVPPRALFAAAVVGGLAVAVYRLGLSLGNPMGVAAFFAGATVSLLSELLSRVLRMPTSVFTIPAFLPLVPGSAAFRTLLDFAGDDYAAGTASLVRTAIIVVALAAGIGTVSALARLRREALP